jgi:DNA-binding transcriptional LysR family regulator
MYTIDQLSAFIAVYEGQSYSKAARKTGKSRTTIREHILSLEDVLGYELFTIKGRQVVPTNRAEQLYIHAKLVHKQHQLLFARSTALFEEEVYEINVAYDVLTPMDLITSLDSVLTKEHPYLTINWLHRTRNRALELMDSGKIDFAIMPNRDSSFPGKTVSWSNLGNISLGCFVSSTSPLANKKNVKIIELENVTQYLSENVMQLARGVDKLSHNTKIVSNNDLLCALLKQDGWSAMPHNYIRPYVKNGTFVEVDSVDVPSNYSIGLNLFYPTGKEQRSNIYLTFIEQCNRLAKQYME